MPIKRLSSTRYINIAVVNKMKLVSNWLEPKKKGERKMATEGGVHRLVTCVVVGAGERGTVYSKFATAFPDRLRVVGVAEPRKSTKAAFSA